MRAENIGAEYPEECLKADGTFFKANGRYLEILKTNFKDNASNVHSVQLTKVAVDVLGNEYISPATFETKY